MAALNRSHRRSGPLLWLTANGELVRSRDCPKGAIPAFNRKLIGRGYYRIGWTDTDAVIAWKQRANRLIKMFTALSDAKGGASLKENRE